MTPASVNMRQTAGQAVFPLGNFGHVRYIAGKLPLLLAVSGMKRYSWFDVYSAAMLETDSSKLDERLDAARRILKVARTVSLSADEHQAIADALNNLFAVEMHEHQTRSRKASG